MKRYVSIDIGGTAIKYGVLNERGDLVCRNEMKTEAYKGGASILAKAINIVKQYTGPGMPDGICISTAGMVDTKKGEIFHSASLIPNYAGTRFKEVMETEFEIPCEVENDVNCAGLAESVSGVSKGCNPSLMLTVGTGIGGCVVMDGKVFHGFCNSACEVGYMHMAGSDFQTLGAASILSRKVAEWKNEPEDVWNGYHIFEEAKKGDVLCIRAINEMTDVLGQGIANICYILNPQIVVLGGGIMAQEDYLREPVCYALKKYLLPGIADHTRIAFAKHKNDAGMLGAFYHFMQRQGMKVK